MSISGFNTKTPTIKRILKEASELSTSPSTDYTATPLESNLFEWHFTVRGPPSPSPFDGGIYHGRIVLPPSYPLRPPSFRFLTPSGRFEPNREICLSISGFHEESWQPAWGIRTAIVAIRSFMDSDAGGQVGGMSAADSVKKRFAQESQGWRCAGCGGKSCKEIMEEQERLVKEVGSEEAKEEKVPEELRLGYKDELGKGSHEEDVKDNQGVNGQSGRATGPEQAVNIPVRTSQGTIANGAGNQAASSQGEVQQQQQQIRPPTMPALNDGWIDKAIIGVAAALGFLVLRMIFL